MSYEYMIEIIIVKSNLTEWICSLLPTMQFIIFIIYLIIIVKFIINLTIKIPET